MTPQSPTPAPFVLDALVAALLADAPTAAILATPGVYSGRAPRGADMPYVTLDNMQADALPTFDGKTGRGTFQLKLWAADLPRVIQLYAAVAAVLDRRPLDLSAGGYAQIDAGTQLVTTFPDPSDTAGHQGVVNYVWAAQVLT